MTRATKTLEFLLLILLTGAIILSAFYLAQYIEQNDAARILVENFNFFGMVAVGIVSGLNAFVPVHAATFAPVFAAAGFSMLSIISALVIGTLIADLLSYQVARWGKNSTRAHFPKFDAWLTYLKNNHHNFILPGIFIFASVVPLPNEILLIPLGLMGYHFWTIAGPLALGTLVNQILYAYGFTSIFAKLF